MIAIYARQSIDKKDSISIDTQIDFCRKEITPGNEVMIFQDKGFSGKNTDRPSFQEMMSFVKTGRVSKIIVYRLDRISRSITDFGNIIEALTLHNVDFVSSTEKFDTSMPVGRAMLYIVMVFAQLERETIAERIRDNYYSRGQLGVWLGGPAPIGFQNVKAVVNGKKIAKLVPNEDSSLVQQIYEQYAKSSISLGGLAKELRQEYGGMWDNIKLSRILHNPVYVRADADIYNYYSRRRCIIVNPIDEFTGVYGCSLYGKRDRGVNKYNAFEDQVLSLALHDGIIDSKIWLLCQDKMSHNKQIKNSGKGKHTWLSGIVKCGYCGYTMVCKTYKSPYGEYKYLTCTGRERTDKCTGSPSTHHVEDIENQVCLEILHTVESLKGKEAIDVCDQNDQNQNDLKIELHKIEREIEKLVNAVLSANETLIKYINEKILELDKKKNALLDEMKTQVIEPAVIRIPNLNVWEESDLELRREMARLLIERVSVFTDEIEIVWML